MNVNANGNFVEKNDNFWQFFDIQMAIFQRVSHSVTHLTAGQPYKCGNIQIYKHTPISLDKSIVSRQQYYKRFKTKHWDYLTVFHTLQTDEVVSWKGKLMIESLMAEAKKKVIFKKAISKPSQQIEKLLVQTLSQNVRSFI